MNSPPVWRPGDSSFVVALLPEISGSGDSSPSTETGGICLATDELKQSHLFLSLFFFVSLPDFYGSKNTIIAGVNKNLSFPNSP